MEIWANIHKTFYLATELYKVLAYDKATEINLVWMVSAWLLTMHLITNWLANGEESLSEIYTWNYL